MELDKKWEIQIGARGEGEGVGDERWKAESHKRPEFPKFSSCGSRQNFIKPSNVLNILWNNF